MLNSFFTTVPQDEQRPDVPRRLRWIESIDYALKPVCACSIVNNLIDLFFSRLRATLSIRPFVTAPKPSGLGF